MQKQIYTKKEWLTQGHPEDAQISKIMCWEQETLSSRAGLRSMRVWHGKLLSMYIIKGWQLFKCVFTEENCDSNMIFMLLQIIWGSV